MIKIKSWDELETLRQKAREDTLGKNDEWVVTVGMATCGIAAGADQVMDIINEEIKDKNISNVKVLQTGCYGNCYAEPVVEVRRGDVPLGKGVRYGHVNEVLAREIVYKHLLNEEVIEDAVVGRDQEVYVP